MDIPALSMIMAQQNITADVGTAMLSKSLDMADTAGSEIVNMMNASAMQQSITPYLGGNIDIMC